MHHAIVHGHNQRHLYIRVPASIIRKHELLDSSFPHATGNVLLPVKRKKLHHHLEPGHKVQFHVVPRNVKKIAFTVYLMPVLLCMIGLIIGIAIQAPQDITLFLGILLYWIGIMITRILHKNHALFRLFDIHISK